VRLARQTRRRGRFDVIQHSGCQERRATIGVAAGARFIERTQGVHGTRHGRASLAESYETSPQSTCILQGIGKERLPALRIVVVLIDSSKVVTVLSLLEVDMKRMVLGLCSLLVSAPLFGAPQKPAASPAPTGTKAEQEVLSLSKEKWRWMSERKVDSLAALFHEEAVFVHMGATMSKTQELEVIKSGRIHYKDVEIQESSVRFIGSTAIVLNKIRLVAVVGGNEVTNPFQVTEVYLQQGGTWTLGSLSFTRLMTPGEDRR
jgi:hypothetical protein